MSILPIQQTVSSEKGKPREIGGHKADRSSIIIILIRTAGLPEKKT